MSELQEVLNELANQGSRIENIEGHFDNFNTTLNNHMTDYDKKLEALRSAFKWAFWILFSLFMVAFGGMFGLSIALLQYYLRGG